jgi:hypothetical protein
VRDVIERRDVLRRVDGIQQRQQQHGRLEAQAAGLRREPRQERDRLRLHRGMRDGARSRTSRARVQTVNGAATSLLILITS